MTDDPKTTAFPPSTPENRRKIGCRGRAPNDYSTCWCGYHSVDGYGCCPECVQLARRAKLTKAEERALLRSIMQ